MLVDSARQDEGADLRTEGSATNVSALTGSVTSEPNPDSGAIPKATASGSWEPAWARRFYRCFAPVYDPFRRVWSSWTPGAEAELDRLFRDRIHEDARILELAPGTGINLDRVRRCAASFHSYVGIDVSDAMLIRARTRAQGDSRVALLQGDATDLDGFEPAFDFVVSTWLLSHLEDPAGAVRAAVEKLAPGGSAVFVFFTAPRSRLLRWPLALAMRAFRARFVDPESIRRLPHLESFTTHGVGIATVAVFRR